ncbi:MAG: hypothetical protein J5610_03845 [Prevotella sp.]|nr:hypothetical protein [Prevotella sp.]
MLINCPECGHRVSDKAPVCPQCGVEIAGHVTKATDEEPVVVGQILDDDTPASVEPLMTYAEEPQQTVHPQQRKQKKSHATFLISFIIAALVCSTLLYFYKDALNRREAEDFEIAIKSKDTMLLRSYINAYEKSNRVHIAAIRQRLEKIIAEERLKEKKLDEDPAKVVEEVKAEEQPIVEEEPREHTVELSQAETQETYNALRRFFLAINNNNREKLTNAVADALKSFNGKSDATKNDVLQFLIDQYQADVKNQNWHLGNETNIVKKEDVDGNVSYHITIPAKRVIERESGTSTVNYIVTAVINEEGKITSIEMKR